MYYYDYYTTVSSGYKIKQTMTLCHQIEGASFQYGRSEYYQYSPGALFIIMESQSRSASSSKYAPNSGVHELPIVPPSDQGPKLLSLFGEGLPRQQR